MRIIDIFQKELIMQFYYYLLRFIQKVYNILQDSRHMHSFN